MEEIKKEEQKEQNIKNENLNNNTITISIDEYKKLIVESTKQQSYNQITPQATNNYVIVEENKPIEKKEENGDIF